jgi:hypothetical protein
MLSAGKVQLVEQNEATLVKQAKMVLDFNWTGEYTKPGPRLYPHQWSWDSALISMGYAHYVPERAIRELTHLFDAQWKNGLLPQIVFDPSFGRYFPGVDFWHASESPDAPVVAKTSGIVQPPVHATAVLYLYRHAPDHTGSLQFLKYAFPRLVAWHGYLHRERDPGGEGLAYIRHPWESGMDDSPMWDAIMIGIELAPEKIPQYQRPDTRLVPTEDRPVSAEYDRFASLVELFADRGYDETRIRQDCPFLVQDVLFNTLLCQAERDLAEIARILGEDHTTFERRADCVTQAVNEKLWNEEHTTYLDFDLVANRPIHAYVAANFLPLYGGIPDEGRAQHLVRHLKHGGFGLAEEEGVIPVPSYDRYGFGFSPVRYWRGPVWINIDWFLMRGLQRYGYIEHAERLRRTIVALCRDEGFYEYFDSLTGMGHGSDLFSWTAALLLEAVLENH